MGVQLHCSLISNFFSALDPLFVKFILYTFCSKYDVFCHLVLLRRDFGASSWACRTIEWGYPPMLIVTWFIAWIFRLCRMFPWTSASWELMSGVLTTRVIRQNWQADTIAWRMLAMATKIFMHLEDFYAIGGLKGSYSSMLVCWTSGSQVVMASAGIQLEFLAVTYYATPTSHQYASG